MKIEDVRTFEGLEQYLKEFRNFHDEPVPYDFNGTFHLFLALLDNLARNHIDADMDELKQLRPWFTDEQLCFLKKIERLA